MEIWKLIWHFYLALLNYFEHKCNQTLDLTDFYDSFYIMYTKKLLTIIWWTPIYPTLCLQNNPFKEKLITSAPLLYHMFFPTPNPKLILILYLMFITFKGWHFIREIHWSIIFLLILQIYINGIILTHCSIPCFFLFNFWDSTMLIFRVPAHSFWLLCGIFCKYTSEEYNILQFFTSKNISALNILTLFLMHPLNLWGQLQLAHRIYIFPTSLDFAKFFPMSYTY